MRHCGLLFIVKWSCKITPRDKALDSQFSRIGCGVRRSIMVRETNLTGVAQYDLTAVQVDFPDVVEISCCRDKLAAPAREVYGVADDGVQTRGHEFRGSGRLTKGKGVSR